MASNMRTFPGNFIHSNGFAMGVLILAGHTEHGRPSRMTKMTKAVENVTDKGISTLIDLNSV